MPCHAPIAAWRSQAGKIQIGLQRPADDADPLRLPCGKCLGCILANTKEWTLRCHLEQQQHPATVFTTLTLDRQHQSPTLCIRHVQLWLKRLRKAVGPDNPLRHFTSGEYGETNGRPHYHSILFGLSLRHSNAIHQEWNKGDTGGFTRTKNVSPQAIAYVAGYTSKKLGLKHEYTTKAPPFRIMSTGIGGHARSLDPLTGELRNEGSWREFAILNGAKIPVPRYYHENWKQYSSDEEIEKLRLEKLQYALNRDTSQRALDAAEEIDRRKRQLQGARRKL